MQEVSSYTQELAARIAMLHESAAKISTAGVATRVEQIVTS